MPHFLRTIHLNVKADPRRYSTCNGHVTLRYITYTYVCRPGPGPREGPLQYFVFGTAATKSRCYFDSGSSSLLFSVGLSNFFLSCALPNGRCVFLVFYLVVLAAIIMFSEFGSGGVFVSDLFEGCDLFGVKFVWI